MSACHVSAKRATRLHIAYSGFRMVQLHASGKTTLCEQAKLGDDELVEL